MFDLKPQVQSLFETPHHRVDVLRLDLIHPEISGNKWFKLKRNLEAAIIEGKNHLLTFGGVYSNHIAATASAGEYFGFKTTGIIRGEKIAETNFTLRAAKNKGMELLFVDRATYLEKEEVDFLNRIGLDPKTYYVIPEGGNNVPGIEGCSEILQGLQSYDYIVTACGTGATYAGLLLGKERNQILIGVSTLKGENRLGDAVYKNLQLFRFHPERIYGDEEFQDGIIKRSCILSQYAFSGYAAFDEHLIDFKSSFEKTHHITLDHVYTTKSFYAAFDLLKTKRLKEKSSVLIIHTGGLQGNEGFEMRYRNKLIR